MSDEKPLVMANDDQERYMIFPVGEFEIKLITGPDKARSIVQTPARTYLENYEMGNRQ